MLTWPLACGRRVVGQQGGRRPAGRWPPRTGAATRPITPLLVVGPLYGRLELGDGGRPSHRMPCLGRVLVGRCGIFSTKLLTDGGEPLPAARRGGVRRRQRPGRGEAMREATSPIRRPETSTAPSPPTAAPVHGRAADGAARHRRRCRVHLSAIRAATLDADGDSHQPRPRGHQGDGSTPKRITGERRTPSMTPAARRRRRAWRADRGSPGRSPPGRRFRDGGAHCPGWPARSGAPRTCTTPCRSSRRGWSRSRPAGRRQPVTVTAPGPRARGGRRPGSSSSCRRAGGPRRGR